MNKIDFVLTWVDGSDQMWMNEKKKYAHKYNMDLNDDSRYRDNGLLKFWFRSVEKNAPWVNKIFFITAGHVPKWLDLNHPKLEIISHTDYIASKYLPTFNSNVIELNLGFIESLSNNFVNFNDDMYLNSPVKPTDFFKGDVPCDSGIFSPIVPKYNSIDNIVLNNVEIINLLFNIRKVQKNNFFKIFNFKYGKHNLKNICTLPWNQCLGFYDNHIPISCNKSSFEKIYDLNLPSLKHTFSNRFRTKEDISYWLIRYFQICEGNFYPRNINFGSYYQLGDDNHKLIYDIKNSKHKVICINDNNQFDDLEKIQKEITHAFEEKYNEKSSFEK